MTLPSQIKQAFPPRPVDLHKYSAGTVTVVGGSHRFANAPAISGLGARAAGAGLVHLVVPDASRIAAAVLVPEATFLKQTVACVPPKADVCAIGMGLGVSPASEVLVSRLVSGCAGRFILDADALSVVANWYACNSRALPVTAGQTIVMTPHAGEAARLLDCKSADITADRPAAIRRLVKRYNATVVLKGPHTLVASPADDTIFECPAGNPFMAMGGTGDLLSGVIAARWAYLAHQMPQDTSPHALAALAASSAVWLHAAASDALVAANPPEDPSLVNTARKIAVMRVQLERESGNGQL